MKESYKNIVIVLLGKLFLFANRYLGLIKKKYIKKNILLEFGNEMRTAPYSFTFLQINQMSRFEINVDEFLMACFLPSLRHSRF